ncbi:MULTISPECIES: DedA family protein [unclassified Janibacter]|uniref:DedA family protein n=1 Tax=unclassified Janibacter TaxID=2649294 RepID=UPI003D058521
MQGIVDWILEIMDAIGGPGIALAIFLENVFPPIPSEVVLPLAGFTAGQGRYTLVEAVLWATLGSVTGALLLYGFGALVGMDRLRAVARAMPLVDVADVDKADAWFTRHGGKAVFIGRLIPGVRSLISIPAGVDRMRVSTFVLLTTVGSLIWNTALVTAGYALGDNWEAVQGYVDPISKIVLLLLLLALVGWIVMLVRRRLRRGAEGDPDARLDRR